MSERRPAVVGIGASAGGLDAFRIFFRSMPTDSGMAFVVILHLPADRKSMLPEILQRWTGMRVDAATDGLLLEANHVYVPPPHAVTMLSHGRLRIHMPPAGAPRDYRPIDNFFDSLATNQGEEAIGIVLSGTGSDGALGLKAIKERGGLTIAQGWDREGGGTDAGGPIYDGMPSGAIATGAVDLIAAADAIPAHLLRIRRARVDAEAAASKVSAADAQQARLAICRLIRARIGHDFSGYKDKTFNRRVQRRMQMVGVATTTDYIARLEGDRDEIVLLFRDLLIRVTSFFRDAETFAVLEQEVIPRLFRGKQADSTVRIWVPGCATGEEAYSLAILLREHMEGLDSAPSARIFGTDIDEPAIATARLGLYPSTLIEGLSPARRERFFVRNENGYMVSKSIRDLCTFSPHSLVRDPPFSRMDLISCRNLLIYMDTKLQSQIMPAFHYSLVPHGILLLGSSESTARHEHLFTPIDKAARIFERQDIKSAPLQAGGDHHGAISAALLAQRGAYAGQSWWPSRAASDGRPDYAGRNALQPGAQGISSHDTKGGGQAGRPSVRSPFSRLKAGFAAIAPSLFAPGLFAPGLFANRHDGPALSQALMATQQELQSVTEEHMTALEELRSANEELHSVNEELQSTNEELETSKEEIQSVNEELHTVNGQISGKVDELDRANSDLRNLFESTQIATIFLGLDLVVRTFTPAATRIYNLIASDQGRKLTDIVSQVSYSGLLADVSHVIETAEALERRLVRTDGTAHYLMRILPYRGQDRRITGAVVTFLDVTSLVDAEGQRLLVDELNHRVKNILTVVTSLASQTIRGADSLETFSEAFLGRLRAVTASYSLLSQTSWTSVSLRAIVEEETKPFLSKDGSNLRLEGPEVRLSPAGALALGMTIHELATNALKYGGLSVAEGRVDVTWRIAAVQGGDELVLDWAESGGPAVSPPTRRGFGMTLIERSFAHDLGGKVSVRFEPSGVLATLHAPASQGVLARPVPELHALHALLAS